MPPKSSSQKNGKILQKEKKKIIEDKTFGLKNKNKSKKVEKFVQKLEQNITNNMGTNTVNVKQKKKEEQKVKEELAQLFKPVQVINAQKVAVGVDPKSVVCMFFKVGQCTKGKNCKFSHDLELERKTEKINLYTDVRDEDDKLQDTMDTWDQNKLESVVNSKEHGHGQRCKSDIVCRYFLEAIEQRQYGWLWECPNGADKCQYRHALPPGYILKTMKNKEEEAEVDEITLEDFLETERHKLQGPLTPITETSFAKWKEEKKKKREEGKRMTIEAELID
jgi:hypothetical protein